MTIRHLDALFHPQSIAVVGASRRPRSAGEVLMRNLLQDRFSGTLYPVNPKYDRVLGIAAYASVDALPTAPDLAVICTPPASVPQIIDRLGRRGTHAAIVISPAATTVHGDAQRALVKSMLDAAKPHLLRILGPTSFGLLSPSIALNASFAHTRAHRGNVAFISQSSALAAAVLDRAHSRGIGFSHFAALGTGCDVDVADMLDYLGSDAATRAILLYLATVENARKFMSAARAAARNKPLIVVKGGRSAESAQAAAFHTGTLAGEDAVFDAAIRRAGMLRVRTLRDLFAAAETLSHITTLSGERLAIIANGGGPGVVAADEAALEEIALSVFSAETQARLQTLLPYPRAQCNPVNLLGDAPVERYVDTLRILAEDTQTDAIVLVHAPSAFIDSAAVAQACVPAIKRVGKPVLSCWLGGDALDPARKTFHENGIADYATPEEAVRAFSQLFTYRKNQDQLLETPRGADSERVPDRSGAARLVARALESDRDILSEPEAKAILAAYGVPVVETRTAATPEGAGATAAALGFPVAVKLISPDLAHKSAVGAVALGLSAEAQVRAAAEAMRARVAESRPQARIEGFTIQPMVARAGAHELIVGATRDPVFGPVILFGQGGTDVEVLSDRAIGLPPLNVPLARALVMRTRVGRHLARDRGTPHAGLDAIYDTLSRLSQLIVDIPEIVDVDVNPLLVDENCVMVLDAGMRVARSVVSGHDHLAIRPYPEELEERIDWCGRQLLIRPIRPEDTRQHLRFLQRLSPHDVRMRVFHTKRYIAPSELARLTQIDYEREMAFIATSRDAAGAWETLGVVRIVTDPENARAEFAVIVRSDIKGRGLGRILLDKIIRYCRSRGTETIVGDVLRENTRMLELTRQLGFTVAPSSDPGTMQVTLSLRGASGTPPPAS